VSEQPKAGQARSFAIFLAGLVVLVAAGVGLGAILFSPPEKKLYDRSSPDAVLAAAKDMVVRTEAERLGELFYADSDGMRELYARFGAVLGRLQDLAIAINERFPEDVARIKADAEAAAKSGRATSLLQQFNIGSRRSGDRSRSGPDEDRINQIIQTIAADPYAWITDAEGRLSYTTIDDERVAVLWDNKPVLAPLGLVMQQDQGGWSVVLPLASLPMASRFMPQTPEEYSIWASLLQITENVIIDLETDVREGKLQSLDALARHAGEKAAVPMFMGMIAYNKALEERRRREREAREPRVPTSEGG
jgi:hypothetical protein